jgi:hypothetical protein
MPRALASYRAVLFLTSAIALIELAIFLYLASFSFEAASRAIIRVVMALGIVFGIWVQSNIIRYLAALWLVISGASVFWPLISIERFVISVPSILFLVAGTLSLVAAPMLVFSRTFSQEFSREREMQPAYKKTLWKAALVVVLVAIVVATLNDIYNIAQQWSR